jgi:hypothetical protein
MNAGQGSTAMRSELGERRLVKRMPAKDLEKLIIQFLREILWRTKGDFTEEKNQQLRHALEENKQKKECVRK